MKYWKATQLIQGICSIHFIICNMNSTTTQKKELSKAFEKRQQTMLTECCKLLTPFIKTKKKVKMEHVICEGDQSIKDRRKFESLLWKREEIIIRGEFLQISATLNNYCCWKIGPTNTFLLLSFFVSST